MIAHFLYARTNPSPVPRASVFGSHSHHSRQDCYSPSIAGVIWLMKIQCTLRPSSTLARGLHEVFDSAGSESAHTVWRRRTLPWPMDPCRRLSILGRGGSVFPGAQSEAYEVLASAYSKTYSKASPYKNKYTHTHAHAYILSICAGARASKQPHELTPLANTPH